MSEKVDVASIRLKYIFILQILAFDKMEQKYVFLISLYSSYMTTTDLFSVMGGEEVLLFAFDHSILFSNVHMYLFVLELNICIVNHILSEEKNCNCETNFHSDERM